MTTLNVDRLNVASSFLIEFGLYVVSFGVTTFHLRCVMGPEEILTAPGCWTRIPNATRHLSNSHHDCNTRPLLWPLTKARRCLRYRDHIQRCRVRVPRPWSTPPNPIRHEASTSPTLDLVTTVANNTQVPQQSKSWVCKNSFHVVLRS